MNSFVSLCVLDILYIALTVGSDCPDLWITYHDSCYLFGHQTYAFPQAQHYCQSYPGGHLVHLNSHDENVFVRNHVHDAVYTQWWIGLTDDDVESVWVWTGTGEKAQFTDWGYGEPNGGYTESCVEFKKFDNLSFGIHWNDAPCGDYKRLICEKPIGNGGNPGIVG